MTAGEKEVEKCFPEFRKFDYFLYEKEVGRWCRIIYHKTPADVLCMLWILEHFRLLQNEEARWIFKKFEWVSTYLEIATA